MVKKILFGLSDRLNMEVYEKINYLLNEKNMKKTVFIKKLIALQPKLKNNDLIPTQQTIYRYLNGTRELKIELLPFIAEVLQVEIQELFEFNIEYASEYSTKYSKEIREIVDLMYFLPKTTLLKLKNQLLEYKKLHEHFKV